MKEFKISCHSISKIMAGEIGLTDVQKAKRDELQKRRSDHAAGVSGVKPLTENMKAELEKLLEKEANPELPVGAKTFLKTWVKKKLFNRNDEWKSIVVDKGLGVELEGIKMVGRILGIELQKNDEFFDQHPYIQGSPDCLPDEIDVVRDVKSSWDLFSFPMFDDQLPNQDYWWQMQGYMILTGRKKACLDYVLIDTPMPLVLLDLKRLYYQSGGLAEDWTPDKYQELYPNYQFSDIPEHLRVKSFEVEYDPTAADKIVQRVRMCREYIKTIVPSKELLAINE